MLSQIPKTMPKEHYAIGSLNLLLFIVFAIILIVFGVYFLFLTRRQEIEAARRIKLSFGLFGVFYGICRIIFILMFQEFTEPDKNYDLFCSIAYSFGMIGFTSIIWSLEKAKYKTKYFFLISLALTAITIAGTILTFLRIAEIRETILIIIMLGTPMAGFFVFILYVQLIRLSSGIVKKKALYSLIGFLIMVVGITMDGQFFLAIETIPNWFKMDIVPLICIAGFLLFLIAQL